MATTTHIAKRPISALPLPPPSHLLIHNLTPDTETPSVSTFSYVLQNKPSVQRRARIINPKSHFSHVSPFPLPFPYDIAPPEGVDSETVEDKGAFIEQWLAKREGLVERDSAQGGDDGLRVLYAEDDSRDQRTELLALSKTGLRDCLPHLAVGDAFSLLGEGSLSQPDIPSEEYRPTDSEATATRQTLVDVLGARAILMSGEDNEVSFAPWALRYSGHQFGTWAGQLGDGRAITILATPHPSNPEINWELQLKGGGRTPFSRTADGLAVVRSSIREYLCAEAMQALGIPTTRSLALVSLPDLPVVREKLEAACITTRMAPSFIRIGSFEALNPPARMFFFGGGQQDGDFDALRVLGEWVANRVLRVRGKGDEGAAWGKKLVLECAKRNARMVAGWQAYGFMHGVINTDNVSILGLTIDYGPYAFMDVFDRMHICNHTDGEGRYAYRFQPAMIHFALRKLLNALEPLIGAEAELGKAVSADWARDATEEKISEWRKKGAELVEDEMDIVFHTEYEAAYAEHMRMRLGLRRAEDDDDAKLFGPLLDLLAAQNLDFHGTFRHLTSFKPALLGPDSAADLETFIARILEYSSQPDWLQRDTATKDWLSWLEKLSARIESEKGEWENEAANGEGWEETRVRAARGANPRFVLRQWVLEEVIARVEKDHIVGRRLLNKVMQMACNPYEPWGAEGELRPDADLEAEVREERRFCGVGEKSMLGFQCSCSS
ncbi:UPF0061-domain-containing protein [Amylostereum chailletii]|nr:UPF0061-domain-containing protein [Amylostereum chailletii]